MQLEAIASHPITSWLGEETNNDISSNTEHRLIGVAPRIPKISKSLATLPRHLKAKINK